MHISPSHPAYPRIAELLQILCWYTNPHMVVNWRDYDPDDNLVFVEFDNVTAIADCKAELSRVMNDAVLGRFVVINES